MDEWMNGWMDRWMDGQTERLIDEGKPMTWSAVSSKAGGRHWRD
jgi:hypothetical protein